MKVPNAEIHLPIYPDAEAQRYLKQRTAQKGLPVGEMVNGPRKQEIQIIESVK